MKRPQDLPDGRDCGSMGVSRSAGRLEAAARWLVVSAALLAPWLFGASEPWAAGLVSILTLTGAVCWLVAAVACPPPRLRAPGATAAMAGLVALVGLQTLPLPFGTLDLFSPFSASAWREGSALLGSLGLCPSAVLPGCGTLSVAPGATREAFNLLAVCLLAFLVVANGTHHWSDLRRMAGVIVGCGFVLVFVSLIHGSTASRELLWFHVPRHMEYGFGTFANRNHFATHALLLFGLAIGAFLASATIPALNGAGWRERVLFLSTRGASRMAMLALAVVVTGTSVFLSLSRGASMSLMAAVGIAVAAWVAGGGMRGSGRYTATGLILVVAALVVWLGWQPVADRLGTIGALARDPVGDWRCMASLDTLSLFGMSPLFGQGFGSFQYVFPSVARSELHMGRWTHAHNDWVEYLAEGGVLGGAMVLLAIFLFLREIRRKLPGIPSDRRRFIEGCLIGLGAVAIHSTVDFGLRKPANGLLLAVVAGLMVAALRQPAQVITDRVPDCAGPAPGVPAALRGGAAGRLALCMALVLTVAIWCDSVAGFQEALAFKRFERMERVYGRSDEPALIEVVVGMARTEAESCRNLGTRHPELLIEVAAAQFRWAMDRRLPAVTRRLLEGDVLSAAAVSACAAPTDPDAWLWLGRSYALAGRWDDADKCVGRAGALRPSGPPPRLLPGARAR